MAFKTITDEQFAAADKIVKEDRRPVSEAARETGISANTLYKRYRPSADPTPGGRRKSTPKPGPTDEQLTELFTKAAVVPAIPMGLWFHCDFCAAHFVTSGPKAATQLVELSHDNPTLRSLMEAFWRQWETVAWSAILVTWMGVPIAHHAAPDWIYKWLQLPMGLPPRGDVPMPPPHAHTNGNGNGDGPTATAPPPFNPFAGMDTETLMAMAQNMGATFTTPAPDVEPEPIGDDAATPEPTDEQIYTALAADDAGPEAVEDVTPDTDTDE
jgi:hypothetical protein